VEPALATILRLEVPIIVQIGERSMSLKDVVSLVPGAIIDLPKSSDEELDLKVNNKTVGTGVAVKVGENFGMRISFIGDVRERLDAIASVVEMQDAGPEDPPAVDATAPDESGDAQNAAPEAA
jgi:flagellar motor switch protein FliN/FliY